MTRSSSGIAVLGVLLTALVGHGCSEPTPPPPAPLNNRNPGNFGTTIGARRDAGPADAAPTDGATDAAVTTGCIPIEEGDVVNRATVRRGEEEVDFPIRSAVAFYDEALCSSEERLMILALSSTPSCDLRIAPYLVVLLDARDIGDVIPIGAPLSVTFSAALDIFFVEPGTPSVVAYRNCTGADATILFNSLEPVSGDESFELQGNLVDCTTGAPLFIDATFTVPLEQSFERACVDG